MNAPTAHDPSGAVYGNLAVLTEYPGACLAVIDEDHRYLFVSDAKARLLGEDPSSIVGRRGSEIFGEEWEHERRPLVREAIVGATSVAMVETIRGWRCITKIHGIEPDAHGRRRAVVMLRPVAWIPGGVDRARATHNGRFVEARHNDGDVVKQLSPTEIDVLRLIGLGLSTEDLARVLHRSRKTIEWHRSSLGRKLGMVNRVELAMLAVRAGLCSMWGEAGAGMNAVTPEFAHAYGLPINRPIVELEENGHSNGVHSRAKPAAKPSPRTRARPRQRGAARSS